MNGWINATNSTEIDRFHLRIQVLLAIYGSGQSKCARFENAPVCVRMYDWGTNEFLDPSKTRTILTKEINHITSFVRSLRLYECTDRKPYRVLLL